MGKDAVKTGKRERPEGIRPDVHARFERVREREAMREEFARAVVAETCSPYRTDDWNGSWDNAVAVLEG